MPVKFPKPERYVNKKNIKMLHDVPCLVNNRACTTGTYAHHVKTRGAGGGDEPENLMPLCFVHHNEIHLTGTAPFVKRYNLYFDETERRWKRR
ncbi:MAG: DUF968 domain-containing protein [Deltaproteobacteria bacterium]|nr:DUF968 domain-containing protein [Candidatus Zymogenaceae bacterium]